MIEAVVSGGVAIMLGALSVAWRLGSLERAITDLGHRVTHLENNNV